MKNYILTILASVFFTFLSTSGYSQFQVLRTLPDFKSVEVSGSADVYINQGKGNTYLVQAPSDQMQHLEVAVIDGVLKISYSPKRMFKLSSEAVKVYLTIKDVEAIKASGASNVYSENILELKSLYLESSGASDIKVELKVNDLTLKSSGGADIKLKGEAVHMKATASGGSDIDAKNLIAKRAELKASGGADIVAHVTEELSVTASGGSDVLYYGNPNVIEQKKSGGADIIRKN